MLDSCKIVKKQSEAFHTFLWDFFPSLKQNFIAYRSSKVPDCIFEIHQLWQSGFSRVYSNCCCSCSFKPEIIKIGQSSNKMYSNNRVNFQESTTILNAHTKKSLETYLMHLVVIEILLDVWSDNLKAEAFLRAESVRGGKKECLTVWTFFVVFCLNKDFQQWLFFSWWRSELLWPTFIYMLLFLYSFNTSS